MATYDSVRDDTARQLRDLRDQVNSLMEERVSPMLSDAAGRATDAAKKARAFTSDPGRLCHRPGARPAADCHRRGGGGGLRARPPDPLTQCAQRASHGWRRRQKSC